MQQSVTQKLDSPLGGCQAKRHNQARDQEKEEFIIIFSKQGEHQDPSQSNVFLNSRVGEVLS